MTKQGNNNAFGQNRKHISFPNSKDQDTFGVGGFLNRGTLVTSRRRVNSLFSLIFLSPSVEELTAAMTGYGAVDTEETPPADEEFGEATTYYLKDKPATREEKLRKCFLTLFPIFVAALILGFFAVWILRGSGILNQGEHGSRSSDYYSPSRTYSNEVPAPTSTFGDGEESTPVFSPVAPAPKSAPSPKTSSTTTTSKDAACTAHAKCDSLGLTGVCCPTDEGIMLGCC